MGSPLPKLSLRHSTARGIFRSAYRCIGIIQQPIGEYQSVDATRGRRYVSLQRWARPLVADRALVHRAARRLGHSASIPRAIMSRSPEALAFGSRRHFIPASLSLPLCGCLLNRSRDCSRSRVPPRFPRRRYADAPAAALLTGLGVGEWSPPRCGTRPYARLCLRKWSDDLYWG